MISFATRTLFVHHYCKVLLNSPSIFGMLGSLQHWFSKEENGHYKLNQNKGPSQPFYLLTHSGKPHHSSVLNSPTLNSRTNKNMEFHIWSTFEVITGQQSIIRSMCNFYRALTFWSYISCKISWATSLIWHLTCITHPQTDFSQIGSFTQI